MEKVFLSRPSVEITSEKYFFGDRNISQIIYNKDGNISHFCVDFWGTNKTFLFFYNKDGRFLSDEGLEAML